MPSHRTPQQCPVFVRRMDSPIGRIELHSDGSNLTRLTINSANQRAIQSDLQSEAHVGTVQHDAASCRVLDDAAEQLAEYFVGKRHSFDVPLAVTGTEFQRAVWQQLQRLPFGAATSYAQIGQATGRPTAGRAVGGAVGANPIPIIIPCHRVLASNQQITGYSAGDGIVTKVWLLDHEAIAHR